MNQYQIQEFDPFEPIEGKHYFITETVKSCFLRKQISDHFQKHRPDLKEVHSVDDCNVILVFCHIVSRAGTDIDAALNKLNTMSASTPAIFMVFHHTFDPYKIVPDSSRHVTRRNTLTVDCLFYEDVGLLTCDMNEKALTKIVQCFKYQERYIENLQENKWYISLFNMLLNGCYWICGILKRFKNAVCCYNNERSRLIDEV
ncbi:uncharacterized protein LOC127162483 isoform X2 [Labeo rohita]|uniref:uncharacterized protein LOC127162483 isoform X2 n=1 Tax=Labeo rohita TaxID=84645 RepID=UPI0021E2302E|nr:uncharacterized protein LOC127162483 isoform X2 [Labeo rohita]XP_050961220.1 uncharacterized protein LOC127162483 isoform X2 [Labeo rohita]